MKLSLFLFTLLMMPMQTEAKSKPVRNPSSDGQLCAKVREVGIANGYHYARIGDGTLKNDITVLLSFGNRDRMQAAIAAANASLVSSRSIYFCFDTNTAKATEHGFTLSDATAFSASTSSGIKN